MTIVHQQRPDGNHPVDPKGVLSGCDQIIVFCLQSLIFFLPISTALVEIFSTIIITVFFFKKTVSYSIEYDKKSSGRPPWLRLLDFLRMFKPESHYLNWPVGAFLVVNLLSIIFSQYPLLSIKGFVFKLFQNIALLYSFFECVKTRKQLKFFVMLNLAVTGLVVANGLVQYWRSYDFIYFQGLLDGRVLSTFKHPNDFAAYLLIPISMMISLLTGQYPIRKRDIVSSDKEEITADVLSISRQIGLWLLLFFSLLAFGFTFSRGAWVSFALGTVFLGILQRKTITVSFVVCTIFLFVFSPRLVANRNVSFLSDEVNNAHTVQMNSENENKKDHPFFRAFKEIIATNKNFEGMGRTSFWKVAIDVIRAFPILGAGLNTYGKVAPEFTTKVGGYYAHNCYLQMTAETGILGFFSFMWIVWKLFVRTCRNVRRISDPFLYTILLGAFSGWTAFMIHSFVDTNFYSVQLGTLLWLLMAVLVTVEKLSASPAGNDSKINPLSR